MKFTLKAIREELKACQFNPNVPGQMSIIADSNDVKYFRQRAIEQLRELEFGGGTQTTIAKTQMAIRLLTLSLVELRRGQAAKKEPTGS